MKIADMKLTIAGLEEGLEIEREENQRLRKGLELAREWLDGWASAEPYISVIDSILKQGSSTTPAPASSFRAPIVRVTINDQYEISSCWQYAPGLPPGDHDLYCEPRHG